MLPVAMLSLPYTEFGLGKVHYNIKLQFTEDGRNLYLSTRVALDHRPPAAS